MEGVLRQRISRFATSAGKAHSHRTRYGLREIRLERVSRLGWKPAGKAQSCYFKNSIFPLTVTKNAEPRSARSATPMSSGKHFVNLLA